MEPFAALLVVALPVEPLPVEPALVSLRAALAVDVPVALLASVRRRTPAPAAAASESDGP